MSSVIQDVRHGLRLLLKTPGFTLAAILTLALGIGANTAIFTLVHTVLVSPLPYPGADRIVSLRDVQEQGVDAPASYPEYLDWKGKGDLFEKAAASFTTRSVLTGAGDPLDASTRLDSGGLLTLLGTPPTLGRDFRPEEEVAGGPAVAIVSHALWQSRFGADPSLVGRSITLDGKGTTVVGILPAGFRFELDADVWIPLRAAPAEVPRGLHFMNVYAKLKEGVELEAARRGMEAFAAGLRHDKITTHGVMLIPMRDQIVGDTGRALVLLQFAVGAVLLIACANVAGLTLARSGARRREIGVRLALGASRGRLIRQILTENLLLALAGGSLGVLLAWWGVDAGLARGALGVPGELRPALDSTVLGFNLAISIGTGLLFGLVPAWQSTGTSLHAALAQGGRAPVDEGRRGSLRRALVAAEVAVSVVLLVGSGLLLRSLLHAIDEPIGFDPSRVLSVDVHLGDARYAEKARATEFVASAIERISAIPGVESAAAVTDVPLGGGGTNGVFAIEGRVFPRGANPITEKLMATPGYFRTMGIRLVRGRDFNARDREGSAAVAIVNEALARAWFPGEDPIGKRIDFAWETQGTQTIVGIVADTKVYQIEEAPRPAIYLPFAQRPETAMTIVARTAAPPGSMGRTIAAAVYEIDRNQPVSAVRTMESIVADSLRPRRAPAALIALFAAAALVLAALGIYGLQSFSVAQRTREIGLRMALGARAADVLRMVLREGLRTTVFGAGAGLLLSLGLTRFLSQMLFGVSPFDGVTFGVVTLTLAAVALVAAYLPARRATRVEPMAALRDE